MRSILLAPLVALSLSGCAGMLGAIAGPAPAPLARTAIDDHGLDMAWKTFDVALDAIGLLTDRGVIVPGTPQGRNIATAIRAVNRALAAAERFAAAGSATDYATALREATAGMNTIREALGGNNGNR
jgi:hypothetical protein